MNKKFFFQLVTYMIVCLSACFSSCSKDDKEDDFEQTENVSSQDPEGTVVLNLSIEEHYYIGGCEIYIDAANNFCGEQFVSVGLVAGLSKITNIPESGWANRVAIVSGTGYIMRSSYWNDGQIAYQYARIYVVENYGSTATIKYQAPFQLPIKIANTTLTFTSEAGAQTIQFENPTSATVEEKPEWCEVMRTETGITVSVSENLTATQRTGEIVLKNTANSVTINVTQKGASSPKFQAGSGTEQDPYQITNAQQLKYISKALNAHFVLTADISLNEEAAGSGWDPIGKQEAPFTGTLDGQGHTIKNMWMKRPTTNGVGLFGYIQNASINNVRLEISSNGITGGSSVGGLCGNMIESLITKCSVKGNVAGTSEVGGICGLGYGLYSQTQITECYSEGTITCNNNGSNAAGILGLASNSMVNISNCYSVSSLSSYRCDGISVNGNHTKCYFAGKASPSYRFYCGGTYTYYDKSIIGTSLLGSTENARTTAQMKTQSNYEGWDFTSIWKITEGKTYPTLRCFDK